MNLDIVPADLRSKVSDYMTVRVGVEVEAFDSKWVPREYRMFYCRQRLTENEYNYVRETVSLLSVLGGIPGDTRLKVGQRARYWVHMTIHSWTDYWGEGDCAIYPISSKKVN